MCVAFPTFIIKGLLLNVLTLNDHNVPTFSRYIFRTQYITWPDFYSASVNGISSLKQDQVQMNSLSAFIAGKKIVSKKILIQTCYIPAPNIATFKSS
jgi:hypothetical protein